MASTSDPTAPARTVKLSLPLEYQQEVFKEARNGDHLVILARGLGLLQIVTNLLHTYDATGDSLVVVVGAMDWELEAIGNALVEQKVVSKIPQARGLQVVTTDAMSIRERQRLYVKGGVLAITSRIMIVDMLTEQLKPQAIAGIVVLHAEGVRATSTEAFILRLYRQKNSDGFIKAFSDSPEQFTSGFSPLTTMLRNLQLRSCLLWPRFHVDIAASLDDNEAEVVELNVKMSDAMLVIQSALLECIEASLSELKKSCSQARDIETEDWNADNALHKSFDVIIRRQLDPIWHRVNRKTKHLVGDLTTLRRLLEYLPSWDSVRFHRHLEAVRLEQDTSKSSRSTQSPWLFLDAAETLFQTAKGRAFRGDLALHAFAEEFSPVLEELPKWNVLSGLMEEIERERYFSSTETAGDPNGTILIMCSYEELGQLREYLEAVDTQGSVGGTDEEKNYSPNFAFTGPEAYMKRQLRGYLAWRRDVPRFKAARERERINAKSGKDDAQRKHEAGYGRPPSKRRRMRGGGGANAAVTRPRLEEVPLSRPNADGDFATLLAQLDVGENKTFIADLTLDSLDCDDEYGLLEPNNLVVVHPYSHENDDRLLEDLRPRMVIMYSPNTSFIRRVEVYRHSHSDRRVKVYFMYYGDSTEERKFLSAVRREKDAFTNLIKEKGRMAITLTTDTSNAANPEEHFLRAVNTRIAGGGKHAATAVQPRIIVDMREFRNPLPSMLHNKNISVIPSQLTVGDYILSPEICVERKSIPDLIGSFSSGRLFSQCESMSKHYRRPVVLIEFSENKGFSLEPFADLSQGINQSDLQSKLVLLALTFPQVKFIWSSSAQQTADIFEELKQNREEPDLDVASRMGVGEGEASSGLHNDWALDVLRAMPGITEKNSRVITEKVYSLNEFCNMKESAMAAIIGTEAAKKTHRFLNKGAY